MKDKIKQIAIEAAITFVKGAASGFAFTVGAQAAKSIYDRIRGEKKCELKEKPFYSFDRKNMN